MSKMCDRKFRAMAIVLVVHGCVPVVPFTGKLPSDANLNMAGKFQLLENGQVILALDDPCMMRVKMDDGVSVNKVPCDSRHLDAISVIATTPWHTEIRGEWIDVMHIRFPIDWKRDGINLDYPDNLDSPDDIMLATRPWEVSGTQWTPTVEESRRILNLSEHHAHRKVAEVKPVLSGEPPKVKPILSGEPPKVKPVLSDEPPKLEATLDIGGGAIQVGGDTTIVVRIMNHGRGTAHHVVATIRSSIDAVDDQRLDFEWIGPDSKESREVHVSVPASEIAPDAMLLLRVSEAHGFAPPDFSQRVPIVAAKPILSTHCAIIGTVAGHVEVEAGQAISLHCLVQNTGSTAAKVQLEASLKGGAVVTSPLWDILAGKHITIDLPVTIPLGLPLDSTVDISITAQDQRSSSIARTQVSGVVRKRRLCTPGQLTRDQFKAHLADLRAALAAKGLTQAQFDRYEAELLACLPDPSAPGTRSVGAAVLSH